MSTYTRKQLLSIALAASRHSIGALTTVHYEITGEIIGRNLPRGDLMNRIAKAINKACGSPCTSTAQHQDDSHIAYCDILDRWSDRFYTAA